MRDGAGRRALKAVVRRFFAFDLALARRWRRLRGEGRWELGGACVRSAKCCEAPAVRVGKLVWFLPTARRAFLAWQRRVNGFELIAEEKGARVFVFRCTHFDPATRRCDSYESRPGMCRDYPNALLDGGWPDFFPECGYRAIARNAAGLTRSLEAQNLPTEKLAELKKRLHLE
ncbi:MAG: YkgJ family cysteine cluster protein [Deltaproteobacteria bacterium]|nr:YkgJ family cysteine cluster protein [Deltaproteobacteria bacterium]